MTAAIETVYAGAREDGAVAAVPAQAGRALHWVGVCPVAHLEPECGVAALVQGEQIAIFLLADGSVHAVGNRDPYSGAGVISRGIVGSRGDAPTVASPMHKQVFDLRTGVAVEDAGTALPTYPVRVSDGVVEVAVAGSPAATP